MHTVYVIQNDVSKEIYIGYTTDLKARLKTHNARGAKHTTRNAGTWKLVYLEMYRNKSDARAREHRLKHHGSGKHELLKRLKNSVL
jgi:putative endonuclease